MSPLGYAPETPQDPFFPNSDMYATGSYWMDSDCPSMDDMYDADHPLSLGMLFPASDGGPLLYDSVDSALRPWTQGDWEEGTPDVGGMIEGQPDFHGTGSECGDEFYELVLFKSDGLAQSDDLLPSDYFQTAFGEVWPQSGEGLSSSCSISPSGLMPLQQDLDVLSIDAATPHSIAGHWSPWSALPHLASPSWHAASITANSQDAMQQEQDTDFGSGTSRRRLPREGSLTELGTISELCDASMQVTLHAPPEVIVSNGGAYNASVLLHADSGEDLPADHFSSQESWC